jgi:hypothetical protein
MDRGKGLVCAVLGRHCVLLLLRGTGRSSRVTHARLDSHSMLAPHYSNAT